MNLDRLHTLLEAYGADPRHWPDVERAAMEKLIATSPGARQALAEAASLDALLAQDRLVLPHINPLQIAARAAAEPQTSRGAFTVRRMWPNVAGLAAAAIVGFVIGWSGLDQNYIGTASADQGTVSDTVLQENLSW